MVLCLPDDAAKESASLARSLGGNGPKVLDASTAHRVADGWAYGFAEMVPGQADAIRKGPVRGQPRLLPHRRPSRSSGRSWMPAFCRPTTPSPSMRSAVTPGGGKSMIEAYDTGKAPNFELYGLGLEHKHVPELQRYGALTRRPIFVPSVGNFRQGMLVSVPLHLDTLPGKPAPARARGLSRRAFRRQRIRLRGPVGRSGPEERGSSSPRP